MEVSSKIFKICSKFPTICVFPPNLHKAYAWVVKSFQKYANLMQF